MEIKRRPGRPRLNRKLRSVEAYIEEQFYNEIIKMIEDKKIRSIAEFVSNAIKEKLEREGVKS